MDSIRLVICLSLLAPAASYSQIQSDAALLETVRDNATRIYLEQASWTLPDSFHSSGLAETDKKRLIAQWANASAACIVNALARYAGSTENPLSELVSEDGSFSLKGGTDAEFNLQLSTCM